jgi:HD-GYP domain-containing protein (c-di-GMP phosphodiesterase class II)
VAGFAAATGEPLVIDDAYALPAGTPYRVNSSFDEQVGYRTRSMLVIPMKSQRGEVVGVLQLINRKREPGASLATRRDVTRHVVPYTGRSVEHVTALAAQAAVSIENSMLHASIERLFDGFVAAAATAVEARDPTTYGHSRRVARLAVRLAEAVDQGWGVGAYRGARFSRDQLLALRYAALLHDFGKVAVREDVLVKERKLHPGAHARVRSRFVYLAQQTALDAEREKVALLRPAAGRGAGPAAADAALAAVDARRDRRLGDLRELLAAVDAANEPAPPTAATVALLERAAAVRYRDADGSECALLSDDELRHLRIARGNLDDAERAEVESHVAHTYRFLQQIPWTAPLAAVPAIAHTHHEKPNGRGYPRRLSGDAISVSARIIAVADVFDALTASDRSYKPAVPVPHALEVMRAEAAEGGLDADLVQTFAAAGLHLTAQVSGAHLAVGTAPGPD